MLYAYAHTHTQHTCTFAHTHITKVTQIYLYLISNHLEVTILQLDDPLCCNIELNNDSGKTKGFFRKKCVKFSDCVEQIAM